MTIKLLVVDDEPNIAFSIQHCLRSDGIEVLSAGTAAGGIDIVRRGHLDLVLLDVRLPDMSGLDAFLEIKRLNPNLPVVLMTAYARTAVAMEAMSRGAFDYLNKPVDLATLKSVVGKAVAASRLQRTPAVLGEIDETLEASDQILGRSQSMQEVYKDVGRIAPQDVPVLILGESGTGKELIARAIFHHSSRNHHPFLAINCAALPDTLLESELFGHEKGAFTGADSRRIGRFEQANGGTLFLDEIGDMNLLTQAKALRLLQEQQFERLGGNVTVKTDVRIIAATNQDLQERVREGRFRLDLLYRINGFSITLPPLRERISDILLLTDHFVQQFSRELKQPVREISEDGRKLLLQHNWPGNVRELQSAVRYAILHASGHKIEADDFPKACQSDGPLSSSPIKSSGNGSQVATRASELLADGQGEVYRRLQAEVERELLQLAWEHAHGNQVRMAEVLGMSRMTLRNKLRACGLLTDETG